MKTIYPLVLAMAGANAAVALEKVQQAAPQHAAPQKAQQKLLEHVLVSVPLHKQSAETALPVTVLNAEELRRTAAATLGETLSGTVGLASASFGPGVGQPVIRGQQGARVSVLQNGIASADAASLSADHAVAVEALLADAIEILRGPSTLLYGGGAIGGVVNVIDNRIPGQRQLSMDGALEYRHASVSDMDTTVGRLDSGHGDFAFHLDGISRSWNNTEIPGYASYEQDEEHEASKGYIANSDGRSHSGSAGFSYHFNQGYAGLAISRLDSEYGIPVGAHEHSHHEEDAGHDDDEHEEHADHDEGLRIDLQQTRYDFAMQLYDVTPVIDSVRALLSYTDYGHREIEAGGEVGTRYSNDTWQGRLELVHQPLGSLQGVVGMQVLDREFSALGEEAFVPRTQSRDIGFFLIEHYNLSNWIFEGGFRYDHNYRDPDSSQASQRNFDAFSLSASALWLMNEQWQLSLSVSRSERAPSTEELYSNVEAVDASGWVTHAATDAIEIGNTELDTELARNLDLSLRWDNGRHFVTVNAYYNDFSDYIALENTGLEVDETMVMAYIQRDARFYGLEVDAHFMLLHLSGGELVMRAGGDFTRGEFDSSLNGSKAVPRLPPRRWQGRLSWEGGRLALWTSLLHASKQQRPGAYDDKTAAYTRWDAGLDYQWGQQDQLTFFAALKNLGDEEIRLSTSFLKDIAPEAGRSIEVGLRYHF
ncbi:MAG: TonB-dependent receptor [Parahaliea sp.]